MLVVTDGWAAYPPATREHYRHQGTSVQASGLPAHEVLPAVHRVFSLVKRWLMGTMQGSVSAALVQSYFDEWCSGSIGATPEAAACCFIRFCARRSTPAR